MGGMTTGAMQWMFVVGLWPEDEREVTMDGRIDGS